MSTLPTTLPETIPDKLNWLKDRYWKFGQDSELAGHLEGLFEPDEDGQMTAQPCIDPLTGEAKGVMLIAGSEWGKTALIRRALRSSRVLTEHHVDQPGNTLLVTAPPTATLKKLAEMILEQTGYAKVDSRMRGADAWELVIHRLGLIGIKLVIIDECHHLLTSGPGKDVPSAIQSLKHIMQARSGVALMIAGVPALRDAIKSEPTRETYRRFTECTFSPILLRTQMARDFNANFSRCAQVMGVSVLEEDMFVERILFASDGHIGTSVVIAKAILRDAVIKRRDTLSLHQAEQVYRKLKKKATGETPFKQNEWSVVEKELTVLGWAA